MMEKRPGVASGEERRYQVGTQSCSVRGAENWLGPAWLAAESRMLCSAHLIWTRSSKHSILTKASTKSEDLSWGKCVHWNAKWWIRTDTGRTGSSPEPPGQIRAQGSSPHIASLFNNVSRAFERSLPSGKQRGLGPSGIRYTPHSRTRRGPCYEEVFLSFKTVQEVTGWEW